MPKLKYPGEYVKFDMLMLINTKQINFFNVKKLAKINKIFIISTSYLVFAKGKVFFFGKSNENTFEIFKIFSFCKLN